MSVTVDKNGMTDFFKALDGGIQNAVIAGANVYKNALKLKIQGNRGEAAGVVTGIPSKPGEPPNSQTGMLRNSIVITSTKTGTALVGPSVAYGKWLEFGTYPRAIKSTSKGTKYYAPRDDFISGGSQGGYYMAPRPFVRPVAADPKVAESARKAVSVQLKNAIGGAKAGAFSVVRGAGKGAGL